jgi:hypothetical protein
MLRIKITLLLLWTVSVQLGAQVPVIVKDYNNCMEGLQDRSGNWIAQPIYDHIYKFEQGVARVTRGGKTGLINKNGKEIVPAIYQTLNFMCDKNAFTFGTSYQYLQVSNLDKVGVVDTNGNIVVPLKYQGITCLVDSAFIVKDATGTYAFLHLDGSLYSTGLKTEPGLFGHHLYKFVKSEYVPDPKRPGKTKFQTGKGIMNDKAEILIPPLYDQIESPNTTFRGYEVYKDGKYGYYDKNFRLILNCEYDVWRLPDSYSRITSFMLMYGVTGATKNGKTGVISITGDTILPFIFDSVRRPSGYFLSGRNFSVWEVNVDHKWGLVDSTGKWLIQPTLDESQLFISGGQYPTYKMYLEYSYCSARSNGMHGALSLNGDTIVPFKYDTSWSTGYNVIFWNPEEAIRLSYSCVEASIGMQYETVRNWFGSDEKIYEKVAYGYRYDEGYYPIDGDTLLQFNADVWQDINWERNKIPDSVKKKEYPFLYQCDAEPQLIIENIQRVRATAEGFSSYVSYEDSWYYYDYSRDIDDIRVEVVYDSTTGHIWREIYRDGGTGDIVFGDKISGQGILSATGALIIAPGKYKSVYRASQYNGQKLYVAETFTGKRCLIDSTGRFILSPVWNAISIASSDTVWLECGKTGIYDYSNQGCQNLWCAINISTGKFVIDSALRLHSPFNLRNPTNIFFTNHGLGIIQSPSLQVTVPPVYSEIIPLDDSSRYFAVTNCRGKVGITEASGKLVVDTAYNNIYLAECRPGNVNGKLGLIQTYILTNSAEEFMVFNANKGTAASDTSQYEKVVRMLMAQQNNLSQRNDVSKRAQAIKFPTVSKLYAQDFRNWQLRWLFRETLLGINNPYDYRAYCYGSRSKCMSNYCRNMGPAYNSSALQEDLQVLFISDSFMSAQARKDYGYNRYNPTWSNYSYQFENVLQTPRGPVKLELFSLFGDTLWKRIVTDSVMNFLKSHPGIDADCSRPGVYPLLLSSKYTLDDKGVYLYPEWSKNTNGDPIPVRPIIFVPWTGLRPHLKPEMERKIFSD